MISLKRASAEDDKAIKTSANFYRFTDKTNTIFEENINGYGYLSRSRNIEYDYFIKNSGEISLENRIPDDKGNDSTFKLHFPSNFSKLGQTTVFSSQEEARNGIGNGMARVTWAYITGKDVFPGTDDESNRINGNIVKNDYPITKGGTVVFTPQSSEMGYYSHLNKLVINGQPINLPESRFKRNQSDGVDQSYYKTAITYLKSGELVSVSFVPVSDGYQRERNGRDSKPWARDTGMPYYFVTVMNIQGNISMYGHGETREDGSIPSGPDIVFLRDGHGLDYGATFSRKYPVSVDGSGYRFDGKDITTILSVDKDLDFSTMSIYSGYSTSEQYLQRDIPHGAYIDGASHNGIAIEKSRRLIVDSTHPLRFTVTRGSKDNSININERDDRWMGRYYNILNDDAMNSTGDKYSGYVANEEKVSKGITKYWMDIKSNIDEYDFGSTIRGIYLTDKIFKTFSVEFEDLSGQREPDKTINDLLIPRSNNSLTSSLGINDEGSAHPLDGSDNHTGYSSSGHWVYKKNELGFIEIPSLPDGARYYQLEYVLTDGRKIILENKKFLPGQKVYVGQFLPVINSSTRSRASRNIAPNSIDFGNSDSIDYGSRVVLRAISVNTISESKENPLVILHMR